MSNNTGVTPTSVSSGWNLVGHRDSGRLHSELYVRAALASSAGSEVVVVLPSQAKVDLTLVAYSGTASDPVGQWAAETESETTASHVAPALQVDTTSSWVMSYWVDKVSSGDGSWEAPAGAQTRATLAGSWWREVVLVGGGLRCTGSPGNLAGQDRRGRPPLQRSSHVDHRTQLE